AAATVLLDPSPATPPPPTAAAPPAPPPASAAASALARSMREFWDAAGSFAHSASAMLRDPRAALQRGAELAEALGSLVGPGLVAPRLSLNVAVSGERRL